ncbi:MAG: TolC family protein [Candidatus Korobacteraceae bacterium]
MKLTKRAIILVLVCSTIAQAQEHSQHHPPALQEQAGQFEPGTQAAAGSGLTLPAIEEIALKKNPTLTQASAEIRAARGRHTQAGLYPNPVIGYSGEEIRSSARGGQQGFFVEQEVVLGGKLGLNRKVVEQEIAIAVIEAEEQRVRVLNAVRLAFYRTLAAQEMLDAHRTLADLAVETLETGQRLRNVGQSDETEVLQAEIAAQQSQLSLVRQQNQFRAAWRSMAAVIGEPQLPVRRVEGQLEADLPELEAAVSVTRMLNESPAVRIAEANVLRAQAAVRRSEREPVPDLQLRGGMHRNLQLQAATGRSAGMQGFAEIGIRLPLFNRNQGNVAEARAIHERAAGEVERVRLVLYDRASAVAESYNTARAIAERYRTHLLPAAQRSHELMRAQWGNMRVSYPQLLSTQRTLYDIQVGYIAALLDVRASAIALEGFLLIDGLEAPARPGEVDLPVREVNLPASQVPLER